MIFIFAYMTTLSIYSVDACVVVNVDFVFAFCEGDKENSKRLHFP